MVKNQLKTVALLGILSAILLGIGSFFGPEGLIIGLIFAILMNFFSYFYSDKLVLRMYKAIEVKKNKHPELHQIVHEVCQKAKIPMPKIYIIPTQTPNAFATGRNPKNAAIACTEGILSLLSKSELKAVVAHEIGHIKNRDILVATIAATIAAVISYMAMMARWAAIFGGFGGRNNRDGGNLLELLVLAIVAPLIATIVQLAISRSREYLADETAAKLTHQPYELASALEKITGAVKHNPLRGGSTSTASLFITNPFSAKGFTNLFSTHPPVEERVKRLKGMRI
jgi:heat shock protein HtpX